jgi:PAS domain S-box-containing protein
MALMIWASDAEGALVYISPDWEALTGQLIAEAYGAGWINQAHPDDRHAVLESFDRARSARQPYISEFRLLERSGDFSWFRANGSPSLSPDDGELIGYLGAVKAVESPLAPTASWGQIGASTGLVDDIYRDDRLPIEALADQLILAHEAATKVDDDLLLNLIQIALETVGRKLALKLSAQSVS